MTQALAAYLRHRAEIEALLDPRLYRIEWLDEQVATHSVGCMGNDRGVIVFEVKHYPTGAMDVHGLVAAGELEAILGLIEEAENWARDVGCVGALIASRPGWARVLKSRGYESHQVSVRKVL